MYIVDDKLASNEARLLFSVSPPPPKVPAVLRAVKAPDELLKIANHMLKVPVMLGPNITGTIGRIPNDNQDQTAGAFEETSTSSDIVNAAAMGAIGTFVNSFSAAKSNTIYANSETVQPRSNQVLIIIKV